MTTLAPCGLVPMCHGMARKRNVTTKKTRGKTMNKNNGSAAKASAAVKAIFAKWQKVRSQIDELKAQEQPAAQELYEALTAANLPTTFRSGGVKYGAIKREDKDETGKVESTRYMVRVFSEKERDMLEL